METKRIVECLRKCEKITGRADCVGCDYLYLGGLDCYHVLKKDARKRLEELESKKENLIDHNADLNNRLNKAESHIEKMGKQKEAMLKELCDKENLVREAEGRFYELEKELDTLKNATKKQPEPEWISVEDKPFPGLDSKINKSWHLYPGDLPSYFVFQGKCSGENGITHWMRIGLPKQKEQTFRDVFLKAFPKAELRNEDGDTPICRVAVFGYGECNYESCAHCWNQPYFEEEGEADGNS